MQSEQLKTQFGIDMRVLGIATSSKMLLSESGIDLDSWKETFDARAVPCDLAAFGKHLSSSYIPNTAIVDCTASDAPASHYLGWMQQGNHIITPNKKLGSGPLAQYTAVRQLQRESYIHFFYEGTVGAGLPIIGTLKHLMETGDKVGWVTGGVAVSMLCRVPRGSSALVPLPDCPYVLAFSACVYAPC